MRYYTATYQGTLYKSTSFHSLVMLLHSLGAGTVFLSPEIDTPENMPKEWIKIDSIEEKENENE